ncbi:hypothetical protein BDZ91DRAFT_761769 [Kalaharituber pfeilii]|nr:hypothetical protein BDZ91DRAFT_761769 [Kalaharituber pfeilii]
MNISLVLGQIIFACKAILSFSTAIWKNRTVSCGGHSASFGYNTAPVEEPETSFDEFRNVDEFWSSTNEFWNSMDKLEGPIKELGSESWAGEMGDPSMRLANGRDNVLSENLELVLEWLKL